MKKTRRVEVLFTDSEYRKILSAKGDNSVSDYIRSLIKKEGDKESKEVEDFAVLLQKLSVMDFGKLDQRMHKVELALRDLMASARDNEISKVRSSDKAGTDGHIRMIATILAVNAKAVPGENKIFGELIGEDFSVAQPFDFIIDYLRFFSGQRPYTIKHLKRLYPDFFKDGVRSERGNQ